MKTQFLRAAEKIGDQICRDALRSGGRANWISAAADIAGDAAQPYFAAMGPSWYAGTAGVGWFLANLFEATGEKRHRALAREAAEQALAAAEKVETGRAGFHTGWAGIGFAAIETGEKTGDASLVERGLERLFDLKKLPAADLGLDVIDGPAGAIPAIVRVNRQRKSPVLNEILIKMGQHLLEKAEPEPIGISWPTMPEPLRNGQKVPNLTGFAHGAGGIALGLLELSRYFENADFGTQNAEFGGFSSKFDRAARAGFAYEDAHFDPAQGNWPDFRGFSKTEKGQPVGCSCAWCHGAPGIGLSRLRAWHLTGEAGFRKAALAAAETTRAGLYFENLGNYSLCHGLFGNADLLLETASATAEKGWLEAAETAAEECIDRFLAKKTPIPHGSQTDLAAHDLLTGAAGIGYGFLRAADPKKFGSAICLAA